MKYNSASTRCQNMPLKLFCSREPCVRPGDRLSLKGVFLFNGLYRVCTEGETISRSGFSVYKNNKFSRKTNTGNVFLKWISWWPETSHSWQKMLIRLVLIGTSFLWPFRALILNIDLFLLRPFINCVLFDVQEFHVKVIHISPTARSHMSVYIYRQHMWVCQFTHTDV